MTPPSESVVVLDAMGLRALAHPVRVQLVDLLRKHGPSTATRLAERLGVNSGTASYHLRRLGAAGFVEEDVERGNARERWWRSVHRTTRLNDVELADREPEAVLAYMQSVAALYNLRVQQALNEMQTTPREWRRVLDLSSHTLRLTLEEAQRLREEMGAVAARYRRDSPEEAAPDDAVRVYVITEVLPEFDEPREDGPNQDGPNQDGPAQGGPIQGGPAAEVPGPERGAS